MNVDQIKNDKIVYQCEKSNIVLCFDMYLHMYNDTAYTYRYNHIY